MENKDFMVDLDVITMHIEPKVIINKQTVPIDYETSNQLHMLECIKEEIKLDTAQKPHIAWQLIYNTSAAIATEYPTLVHFAIAREALIDEEIKVDRQSKEYKDIVIQLASSINEHCQKLKVYLSPPKSSKESFNKINNSANNITKNSTLDIINLSDVIPSIDHYFEVENKLFFVDDKFLSYLKNIGKNGKQIANKLENMFHQHYETFNKSGKYPLSFWFNLEPTPEQPIFFAFAWIALAKAIWRDEISRRANLIIRGIPAIIENDKEYIIDMLSHNKEIKQTKEQIQIFSHGKLLGEILIPMIPKGTINSILNGIDKMKLIEGHRVLRYVTRTAFNQAINGNSDYRIIRRESFPDIAEELGLKSRQSIANMIKIFQTMAYFDFKRPNFSGNLITLKRFKSAKTHRLDGVEITVGTILLPYRACDDFKSGESNLMIPILSDPLLVGSNQYHAGQYLLQMLVMGEFVRQSIDFAKHGYIKIPQEIWQRMSQECGVYLILNKILDRWTQDGSDGPKFLEKTENNFYKLGPYYQKETNFLIRQGSHRSKQSDRGKVAAIKRQEIKK